MNKREDLSLKYIKGKIKRNKFLKNSDFTPGNLVFYAYNPKDDKSPYDKNPLSLIIWNTRTHILGINFHWAPLSIRQKIIKLFLRANRNNIKRNSPLTLEKGLSKELFRLARPIFRKYIKKRISRRGVVIPHSEMGYVINLRAEHFIGISAEQAWKMSLGKLRK